MNSRELLEKAFYYIEQNGKPYQVKVDNPKRLQRAIHKTLRRYKWTGYTISTDEESVYVYKKVIE